MCITLGRGRAGGVDAASSPFPFENSSTLKSNDWHNHILQEKKFWQRPKNSGY